jgi:hypothetical protein
LPNKVNEVVAKVVECHSLEYFDNNFVNFYTKLKVIEKKNDVEPRESNYSVEPLLKVGVSKKKPSYLIELC